MHGAGRRALGLLGPSAPDSVERPSPARAGEGSLALVLSVLGIVIAGFTVPGLGIAIAAALALTAYRGRRRVQVALVALGVVVTLLALAAWLLLFAADPVLESDEPVRVRP